MAFIDPSGLFGASKSKYADLSPREFLAVATRDAYNQATVRATDSIKSTGSIRSGDIGSFAAYQSISSPERDAWNSFTAQVAASNTKTTSSTTQTNSSFGAYTPNYNPSTGVGIVAAGGLEAGAGVALSNPVGWVIVGVGIIIGGAVSYRIKNPLTMEEALYLSYDNIDAESIDELIRLAKGKSNPGDLQRGMSTAQKALFSKEIHDFKREHGMPPNHNLPWEVLIALAEYARQNSK